MHGRRVRLCWGLRIIARLVLIRGTNMANQASAKPYLSAFCFILSAAVAGIILFVCGAAALDGHDLPPNTLVAGTVALLAAAVSAKAVERG